MLKHHDTGIKHIIKSPHLPCGLKEVAIFGLNFKTLFFNVFDKNKQYIPQKEENQNHHQYCHCAKCINTSDLEFGN